MPVRKQLSPFKSVVIAIAVVAAWPAASVPAFSDALQPRLSQAKRSLQQLEAAPRSNRVVVKFKEGLKVRLAAGRLSGTASADAVAFASALAAFGVPQNAVRRMHARPEAELDAEREAGQRDSGRQLADLNLYFVIDLPKGVSAARLSDRLNKLEIVEFAEPGPVAAPPPVDIAPPTPNFVPNQGYRKLPPQGVGVMSAVKYPGANGKGLMVADIEYSWQINHEDLAFSATQILVGAGDSLSDPFASTDHGTAVLGEIAGRSNAYGVTGIAPAVKVWLAPAYTTLRGYDPASAISLATGKLRRGDVMIIEQQYWACGFTTGNSFGPLEELQPVFDAVSAATAKGIIVVAAAGNGGLDLDAANCKNKFNRAVRDSGAIIVGAGNSADRSRLSFSSYGSRVDVQGWGNNVMTTGYGDAFDPGGGQQKYTSSFSGTSSATPIVTGAALGVQGVIQGCGLAVLGSYKMRKLLTQTGTAQNTSVAGHIGPLPNIRKALLASPAAACVKALN